MAMQDNVAKFEAKFGSIVLIESENPIH